MMSGLRGALQLAGLFLMLTNLEVAAADAGMKRFDDEVGALLERMTLEEKIGQMSQRNGADGEIPDWLRDPIRQGRIGSILNEVDVDGVEPMTSVTPMRLKRREDVVTDGGMQDRILANAPDAREGFFAVPKVVE